MLLHLYYASDQPTGREVKKAEKIIDTQPVKSILAWTVLRNGNFSAKLH